MLAARQQAKHTRTNARRDSAHAWFASTHTHKQLEHAPPTPHQDQLKQHALIHLGELGVKGLQGRVNGGMVKGITQPRQN